MEDEKKIAKIDAYETNKGGSICTNAFIVDTEQ